MSLKASDEDLPSMLVPSTLKKSLSTMFALALSTFVLAIPPVKPFTKAKFEISLSIRAPADVTFAVSVTSAPSSTLIIVLRLAGVISSITPAPVESLPNILLVADTF